MTGRKTIAQAPSGEKTTLAGTEKFPIDGNQYGLVSTIAAYIRTLTQTLTGKTINLTDNTLTGTKAQFNTAMSDADFATLTGSETLTNKTLTAPTMADFTNAGHDHQDADDGGTLAEAALALTDVTTNNSSTSKHGFLKKLDNDSAHFMDGTGAWATPSVAASVATDAIWDAKGDLAGGTGANTAARLAVGTNGQVLSADSAETTGLKWIAAGASALPVDGWVPYSAVVPTRASADDPTFVLTFAGVDLTGTISAGMRLKWTQNATVRYGIVTAIAFSTNTTLTLFGGTDYDVEDTGTFVISLFYYSPVKAPLAFPLDPNKWTAEASDVTQRTQATPVNGTWYNLGTFTISIPIGIWAVHYYVTPQFSDATATQWQIFTTLSTANNSESDVDLTAAVSGGSILNAYATLHREKVLSLAAKTSYYLNTKVNSANLDNLYNRNDLSKAFIRAVCAYL